MPSPNYRGETVEDFERRLAAAKKRAGVRQAPVVTISAPLADKLLAAYHSRPSKTRASWPPDPASFEGGLDDV